MPLLDAVVRSKVVYVKAANRDSVRDMTAIEATIRGIIAQVRNRGDVAVRQYSKAFDRIDLDTFEVTIAARQAALDALEPQTRADTEFTIERVRAFAEQQRATILPLDVEALPGLHLGHRVIPIARVGASSPAADTLFFSPRS